MKLPSKKFSMFAAGAAIIIAGIAAWQFWPREIVVLVDLTEEQRASLEAERRDFSQKLKENPGKVDLYLALGLTEKSLGNLSAAARVYQEGIERHETYYLFYLNLGSIYEDMGRYKDAEKSIVEGINQKPTEVEGYKRLINLFKAHFQGRSDELDAIYRGGIERTRGDLDLIKEYARFLEDRGQIRDAWIYWQEVADKSPDPALAEQEVERLKEILGIQE